jgi:hypothetical protein
MDEGNKNIAPCANTRGTYVASEIEQERSRKIASDARTKVERTAAANNLLLLSEYDRKKKCIDLEYRMRSQQTGASEQQNVESDAAHSLLHLNLPRVGDCISVAYSWKKGMCSNGGNGHIVQIDTENGVATYSVQFIECSASGKSIESKVTLDRITVLPSLFQPKKPLLSIQRCLPMATTSIKKSPSPNLSIVGILQSGYSRKLGAGWHARQFDFETTKKNEKLDARLLRDYHQLVGFLSATKDNAYSSRTKNGKYKARVTKYNPCTVEYLAFAWGVKQMRIHYLERKS